MEPYEHQQRSTWMYWVAILVLAAFVLIARSDPSAGLGLALGSVAKAQRLASHLPERETPVNTGP